MRHPWSSSLDRAVGRHHSLHHHLLPFDKFRGFILALVQSERTVLDVSCFSLSVPSTRVWRRNVSGVASSPTVYGCLSRSKHSARSGTLRQMIAIAPAAMSECQLNATRHAPPLSDCSLHDLDPDSDCSLHDLVTSSKRLRCFWAAAMSTVSYQHSLCSAAVIMHIEIWATAFLLNCCNIDTLFSAVTFYQVW